MHRIIGGVFVLLLALPALRADDPPKDKAPEKPATPAEQYQALLKEAEEAQQKFSKALRAAKTMEERTKVVQEENPRSALAPKFLAFAEQHPKDAKAIDALIWVTSADFGPSSNKDVRAKAIAMLVRDHIQSEKLGAVCQSMGSGLNSQDDAFLRTVIEKSTNAAVQAEATLALAQSLAQRVMIIKRIKDDAEMAKQLESFAGKEQAAELKSADPAKLNAEMERLFRELADKHVANLKQQRLIMLCQQLRFADNPGIESLLRTLFEKDARPEVQGAAGLSLAQLLKSRADDSADEKAAEKLRADTEKLFEQLEAKFADVKFRGGTIGSLAKRELFDLRNLSVGKPAPDVEGDDQDGQKFKLSDYKGKVVLLDFWSEF